MRTEEIAAQLYTLREFTQTAEGLGRALQRLRQFEYRSVQISAIGPIEPATVKGLLDDNGFVCCATHTSLDRLVKEPELVLKELALWDCRYTAVGGFFHENPTVDDYRQFIRQFNGVAGRFEGSGVRLGYHNHSHEFMKYHGKTAMQILLEELDPSVCFELDTYWVTHGGGDPAAWIDKVGGRIPCVHLKDMGMKNPREQRMTEVGEGNLNWPAILNACRSAGTKWYIVEQDTCYRDPFESLRISMENLKRM